jgi:hypothetical protein
VFFFVALPFRLNKKKLNGRDKKNGDLHFIRRRWRARLLDHGRHPERAGPLARTALERQQRRGVGDRQVD